ncbi:MAG TPA: hypothetical protein VLF94_04175 [Chlamydiales bacterium]|nr:hypothetical protein [Chlamydiales bacterium]
MKYLIASILAFSGVASDGWFPVEKVRNGTKQEEEVDRSIWVLFAKNLGDERIQVRFPDDPAYKYSDAEVMEISSERDGETFQLTVQPAEAGEAKGDLLYQIEGKWVREHVVQTDHHFYRFKTISNGSDDAHHKAFVSSFLIEKNG